jgi:hypothetical protein
MELMYRQIYAEGQDAVSFWVGIVGLSRPVGGTEGDAGLAANVLY